MRPRTILVGVVLASAISASVLLSYGWGASASQLTVLMTPPVVVSFGSTVLCNVTNGSAAPITVDAALLDGGGNVVFDGGGPITIGTGVTSSLSWTIEPTATIFPDKCRFTTTTPAAVRADVVAQAATGGIQIIGALPAPILSNSNTQ